MAKAKVSATDVGESSSDSSEAGNRWRKSDSQSKPINGNDESLNEAFLGAHSLGINLHRYLEENRLLGEVELVGCLSEEVAGSISPEGDCSDFHVDLSQNLNNTKWVDIVSEGLGVRILSTLTNGRNFSSFLFQSGKNLSTRKIVSGFGDQGNSSSLIITYHRLNGNNFLEWSQSIRIFLLGRDHSVVLIFQSTDASTISSAQQVE
ncbi:hypothetical protein GQ457_11G030540 [Hibiscus cannabinus]